MISSLSWIVEPRKLLGEHGDALVPRAGHPRNVGAPEKAARPERVVHLAQRLVGAAERVTVHPRQACGLHRNVRVLGQRHQLWNIDECLVALGGAGRSQVIHDQLEVGIPTRHARHDRQEMRSGQGEGHAGWPARPPAIASPTCRRWARRRPAGGNESGAEHAGCWVQLSMTWRCSGTFGGNQLNIANRSGKACTTSRPSWRDPRSTRTGQMIARSTPASSMPARASSPVNGSWR